MTARPRCRPPPAPMASPACSAATRCTSTPAACRAPTPTRRWARAKSVSVSGIALTGAQAGDYQIASSVSAAPIGVITKANLTVSGVVAQNKVYDATTTAQLNNGGTYLAGLYSGDAVTFNAEPVTGVFATKNAGTGVAVSASGYTVQGGDAANYNLLQPSGLTANISQNTSLTLVSITKVYDGSAALPTASGAYVLNGVLGADNVSVNASGVSGSYQSVNVGGSIGLSNVAGLAFSGTDAANYAIGPSFTTNTFGVITARPLSVAIVGAPTKTYDATTAATLAAANYSLTGFVSGEGASVTQTSGTYASAQAGSETVSASLAGSDYTASGATLLSNYVLPTSASGAGQINKAPLTISGVVANDKTYDGGTIATLTTASAALNGVVSGDTVNLGSGGYSAVFASKAVGSNIAVTASGFAISGAQAIDYTLAQPTGLLANITSAMLTLTKVAKVYDSTTGLPTSSLAYTLGGIVTGDTVTVNTSGLSGAYIAKTVGAGISVSLNGLALTGSQAGDYTIAPSLTNAAIGTITPAALTVTGAVAVSKVYDGSLGDALNNTNASLSGLYGGDAVTLGSSSATGTFAAANVASNIAVTASGYTVGGADVGNYTFTQPTGLSAAITAAPLTASIIGTPTRTYNGLTSAALTASNYSLSGFVSGQGATVTQTSGTYASANAGAEGVSATLSAMNFTAGSGTLLGNYTLPTSASGMGQINAAPLTASIIGTPTKTYDGGVAASLAASNYSLSGFVSGQGAMVAQTGGTYASANAGAQGVSTTLAGSDFTAGSGTLLANYVLPTTASGMGQINRAQLTASIIGTPTKTYDGGVAASLAASNYSLVGLVSGQSATVTQTGGTYASANAGAEGVSTTLAGSDFTAGSGTLLSNYTLPTSAAGVGQINAAVLTASIIGAPTKTYDGGVAASLAASNYSLAGFVSGQSATVTQTSGTYASANAGAEGVSTLLAGSDFTAGSGTLLSNYVLPTVASGTGQINAAQLTAAIIGKPTKTYDGGVAASLAASDYTLSGFVSGQSATLTQTSGTYASANAGAEGVSAMLAGSDFTAGSGTLLSNYILPTAASGSGQINPAQLTAAITGAPTKTYDGGVAASLASSDYTLNGFVSGQGATVTQTSGTYASANAGAEGVSTMLAGSDFTAGSGTLLSNYALPTTASGTGQINPAQLTAAITGSPTKTYDGGVSASLASSDYTLSGFVSGQGAAVTQTSGTYASANTGAEGVSATLAGADFTAGSGTLLANYVLPTSATGMGQINAAVLTVSIIGTPTKTYDGGVAASLAASNYSLAGFVSGQGATVTQTGGTYASANAGAEGVSTMLAGSDFTAGSGTLLSNYVLPTTASGTGQINPAQLTAAIIGKPTKTYDGGVAASLAASDYTLSGFVSGQGAVVSQASGTYASANAGAEGVSTTLAGSDFTAGSGTLLSNYVLPTTASGTGQINPAQLTAAITGSPTKTYDGGLAATLAASDYSLSGFVSGQGATVIQTNGTYASANAGVVGVSTTLAGSDFTAGSGTLLANYVLPSAASGTGQINPAQLTATITGSPTKTYDGGAAATLAASNYSLAGFVSGQGATVTQTSGTYASANAGAEGVSATLAGSDFTAGSGTQLSNYTLPTSAAGAGQINAALLTASITGSPTKTYDGGVAASLVASDYSLSGFVSGQVATVTQTSATYASANAGAEGVSTTLAGSDFTAGSGTLLANYVLPTSATGMGRISPAVLTASIIGTPTKTYDGGVAATLAASNYSLAGFVSGQGAAVTQTTGTYASANAGGEGVSTTLAGSDFAAGSGTLLANYVLPTVASGTGQINPALLSIAGVNATSKTYDGNIDDVLASGGATLVGLVPGDDVQLSTSHASGSFATADAGQGLTVTAAGFALSGAGSGNYALAQPTGLTANINPAQLTASITGSPTKTYDGGVTASLAASDYTLSGFVSGQSATVTHTSGTYASANAGAEGVSTTLAGSDFTAGSGTLLGNYVLPTAASGSGQINPAQLTAAIAGSPTKTYDGGLAATLAASDYTLAGFVSGQGATVTQTSGTYASANAGAVGVSTTLAGSDFTAGSGTLLANYVLPTAASGSGQINPALLSASITGSPTKTYDGGVAASLAASNYSLAGFVSGQGAMVSQPSGTYASANAGAEGVSTTLAGSDFTAGSGTLLSNYVLPTTASGTGQINPAQLTAAITGSPTKTYDGGVAATMASADYTLAGFVSGQGATVTQTNGTYTSANTGAEGVSATLAGGDFTAGSGTLLANYVLPTTANGMGLINPAETRETTALAALAVNGVVSGDAVPRPVAMAASFAIATPRIYIPYPAPDALSTWVTSGFATLPSIVDAASATLDDTTDAPRVIAGPPVINSTEQILLQGSKSKSWSIQLPGPEAGAGR